MSGEGNCNNPKGNPLITTYSQKSRFHSGPNAADPAEAVKKRKVNGTSVRAAERRIAGMEFDKNNPPTGATISKMLDNREGVLTGAQIVAIKRFELAAKGHPKFSQYFTEDVDGKLIQKAITAETSLADLIAGSYDKEGDDDEQGSDS